MIVARCMEQGSRNKENQGTRYKEQGSRNKVQEKQEARNNKAYHVSQELEDRFFNFAKRVRDFCARLEYNVINREYISQLVRAAGSVAANYIEVSDSLGKNDERMKLRISRREAKESVLWLKLIMINEKDSDLEEERNLLIDEAYQIKKILSSIILKVG